MLIGLSASCAISSMARADPADFQAMPGLWKITIHNHAHGADQVSVHWKCLYDGADPWTVLVDVLTPDAHCQRVGAHRASTSLSWEVQCAGASPRTGSGRLVLNSEQHYTASVVLNGKNVLTAEGQHYAACTGPAD